MSSTVSTQPTRTLSFGMRGNDVLALQQQLITLGFLAPGNVSGYFGAVTQAAVQKFQKSKGIVSSGTPATTGYGAVGARTRAAIASASNLAYAQSSYSTSYSQGTYGSTYAQADYYSQATYSTDQTSYSQGAYYSQGTYATDKSCTFSGTTVADGATVTAYQTSSVDEPAACASQIRTCSNGTLSGTYTNSSCSVKSNTSGIYSVSDYGAKCDSATDDTAAIQAAETAREAAGGTTLQFPSGYCFISGTIHVRTGGLITGHGASTFIRTTSTSADIFDVVTESPITFTDLSIDAVGRSNSYGAGIRVQPTAAPYGGNLNQQFSVDNVYIGNMHDGIMMYNTVNFSITSSFIGDFQGDGISIGMNDSTANTPTNGVITDTSIWAYNTGATAGADIHLDSVSSITINDNGLGGAAMGLFLTASHGSASTVLFYNNGLEDQRVSGVYVMQRVAGKTYSDITISGNEFSVLDPSELQTLQGGIIFSAGLSGPYLSNAVISYNVLSYGLPRYAVIGLQDGVGVQVIGNTINNFGVQGALGIEYYGNASGVTLAGNTFDGLPSGNTSP